MITTSYVCKFHVFFKHVSICLFWHFNYSKKRFNKTIAKHLTILRNLMKIIDFEKQPFALKKWVIYYILCYWQYYRMTPLFALITWTYVYFKKEAYLRHILFLIRFKFKIIIKDAAKLNYVCISLLWIIKRLLLMWGGHFGFYLFKTKDPH